MKQVKLQIHFAAFSSRDLKRLRKAYAPTANSFFAVEPHRLERYSQIRCWAKESIVKNPSVKEIVELVKSKSRKQIEAITIFSVTHIVGKIHYQIALV